MSLCLNLLDCAHVFIQNYFCISFHALIFVHARAFNRAPVRIFLMLMYFSFSWSSFSCTYSFLCTYSFSCIYYFSCIDSCVRSCIYSCACSCISHTHVFFMLMVVFFVYLFFLKHLLPHNIFRVFFLVSRVFYQFHVLIVIYVLSVHFSFASS